tara:strand:+ start:151 stop:786 length:636 start_codon:yes stop_codon:yes gene_type:complete
MMTLNHSEAKRLLEEGLNSKDPRERERAIDNFGRKTHNDNGELIVNGADLEWSVPILISALGDSSGDVRQLAIWRLGDTVDEDYKDPRILNAVLPCLSDPSSIVISDTIDLLCDLENPEAIEVLSEILKHNPDQHLRAGAAEAIHFICEANEGVNPTELIDTFIEILEDDSADDLLTNRAYNFCYWGPWDWEDIPEVKTALEHCLNSGRYG